MAGPHPNQPRRMGGWRRLFVAGVLALVPAAIVLVHTMGADLVGAEGIELALLLWALGALGLGLLLVFLAGVDCLILWIGSGFGLSPGAARLGLAGGMAFLAALATAAALLRYETVMPEGGAQRTGELCVVLDRWTGEARPCTEQAVSRANRARRPPEPQRARGENELSALWQQLAEAVAAIFDRLSWLTGIG